MTSWPWMNGIEIAIADPIPLVDENDDRPSVKDLIQEHRKDIESVKAALEQDPLYDVTKHDDLWIVRFLLSHKKPKPAIAAAKNTLLFREELQMDDDIRPYPVGKNAKSEAIKRYLQHVDDGSIVICVPNAQRGVVVFFQLAGMNQHELVKHVDESDWLPSFSYMTEWAHQWLDYTTRTTGRLTKSIRIIDCSDVTISSISTENQRRDGKAMGRMEDCYPQLLESIFVVNAPSWVQIPWRVIRPLLPKRVVKKIDFADPKNREKERKRFYANIEEQHLPSRYGGKNDVWPVEFPGPKLAHMGTISNGTETQ